MEALNRLLLKAQDGGFILGFKVGGKGGGVEEISHLLFVDATIVFCEASQEQVTFLCLLPMWFTTLLRLKINLEKSEMIPMGEVGNLEYLGCEIGWKVRKLPSSYLGLPLQASYKSAAVWDGVEERFCKRLLLWKRQHLSKGRRHTLLRSTLASLLIYFISMFTILRIVRLRLKKIQRDFLWRGRGVALEKQNTIRQVVNCL